MIPLSIVDLSTEFEGDWVTCDGPHVRLPEREPLCKASAVHDSANIPGLKNPLAIPVLGHIQHCPPNLSC